MPAAAEDYPQYLALLIVLVAFALAGEGWVAVRLQRPPEAATGRRLTLSALLALAVLSAVVLFFRRPAMWIVLGLALLSFPVNKLAALAERRGRPNRLWQAVSFAFEAPPAAVLITIFCAFPAFVYVVLVQMYLGVWVDFDPLAPEMVPNAVLGLLDPFLKLTAAITLAVGFGGATKRLRLSASFGAHVLQFVPFLVAAYLLTMAAADVLGRLFAAVAPFPPGAAELPGPLWRLPRVVLAERPWEGNNRLFLLVVPVVLLTLTSWFMRRRSADEEREDEAAAGVRYEPSLGGVFHVEVRRPQGWRRHGEATADWEVLESLWLGATVDEDDAAVRILDSHGGRWAFRKAADYHGYELVRVGRGG